MEDAHEGLQAVAAHSTLGHHSCVSSDSYSLVRQLIAGIKTVGRNQTRNTIPAVVELHQLVTLRQLSLIVVQGQICLAGVSEPLSMLLYKH
jgi:hypothetical protein